MNNYCCACGAYLKAPPQPFAIFKLPASLSLCTILFYPPPTFPFLPSLQKQRTLPNSRRGGGLPRPLPRFSPLSQTPPTPHYPSPRTIKNRNSRHRRNHNSSLFIFHFSSFIIFAANPAIPTITAAPHSPSPRTTPILHFSFFIYQSTTLSPLSVLLISSFLSLFDSFLLLSGHIAHRQHALSHSLAVRSHRPAFHKLRRGILHSRADNFVLVHNKISVRKPYSFIAQ